MYVLYHPRMQGWYTGGAYTSDLSKAARFSREAALGICRNFYNDGFAEFGLLPIDLNTLQELRQ